MLLLVDLDGVVYRGSTPVPGVADLLTRRAEAGDTIVYVTNNSRWHRTEYLSRLQAVRAPVSADRIVSAGGATAAALAAWEPRPTTVLVFGGPGLVRELTDVGFAVVSADARGLAARPDTVVVGVDFDLTYERLSVAAEAVRRGARLVATNRDPIYPTADGFMAGAGSMVAAVETAAGRTADLTVGKPEPALFAEAARIAGALPDRAVVIGDGLHSDIAAAVRVGARSILMLTGVTSRAQADAAPADRTPTAIAADAAELERLLVAFAADD